MPPNEWMIAIFVMVAFASFECFPLSRRICPQIYRHGVKEEDLRLPSTRVPTDQSLGCSRFMFALPNDTDYDIIAATPILDNPTMVKYMVLVGCTNVTQDILQNSTFPCVDMQLFYTYGCGTVLAAWTPGDERRCIPNQYGYQIGPVGIQFAMLQIQYNNPLRVTDVYDASGMKIYYTPDLRRYQAGVLAVSQVYLDIPPHQTNVNVSGVCLGQCTDRLPNSIYITEVFFDMDTLGREAEVYLYRDGILVEKLASDHHFVPELPKLHRVKTAVEVKPGDEIQISCKYDSTDRNTSTHFGFKEMDERCTALLTYYPFQMYRGPNQAMFDCGQYKQYGYCNSDALPIP